MSAVWQWPRPHGRGLDTRKSNAAKWWQTTWRLGNQLYRPYRAFLVSLIIQLTGVKPWFWGLVSLESMTLGTNWHTDLLKGSLASPTPCLSPFGSLWKSRYGSLGTPIYKCAGIRFDNRLDRGLDTCKSNAAKWLQTTWRLGNQIYRPYLAFLVPLILRCSSWCWSCLHWSPFVFTGLKGGQTRERAVVSSHYYICRFIFQKLEFIKFFKLV